MACNVERICMPVPEKAPPGGASREDKGKALVIIRALYGLKLSGVHRGGRCWHSPYAMDFESTTGDPDAGNDQQKTESGKEYSLLWTISYFSAMIQNRRWS
jgi:hypothetical protein